MTVPKFPSQFIVLASPIGGISTRLYCGCGWMIEAVGLGTEAERFTCKCGMLYTIRVAGKAVELEVRHTFTLLAGADGQSRLTF